MKTILPAVLCLGLLMPVTRNSQLAAQGQGKTPKAAPVKHVPNPGQFEIQVTVGDRERTYPHPAKALSDIGRALSLTKRAKEGDEPIFEAVMTLNDQVFTFKDPEAAQNACKGVISAMRDLPRLRMGLGDLGEIPEVNAGQQPQAGANPMPMGKSRAAAVAEVRRRIQLALQRQMRGSGRGRPGMPNPITMQRTIQQEIEKARKEGLLPSVPAQGGVNLGAGLKGDDAREAKKEAIVQTLAFTLAAADSVTKAEEKPAEEEEKPTEAKTEDAKPAEPAVVIPDAPK